MRVICGGKPLSLEDHDLLGQGGEARVYRHGVQALKVFHDVDPALPLTEREYAVRLRNLRLRKLRAFPRGLPAHVVSPGDVVTDLHETARGVGGGCSCGVWLRAHAAPRSASSCQRA